MTYPELKNDVNLLKLTTKDDTIRDLQYKTEKQDHEKTLKTLKTDSDSYKKKYKNLNKKKICITILVTILGH